MNGRFNRLVCAVCIMLCGFYSVSLNAAIGGEAVFKVMNITGKSRTSSGIKVDYAVKTQFDHPSIPQNKNVSAGFMAADLAVLFASLKNRNPGAAAVTAGTVAAAAAGGWVIDELTGQITSPVERQQDYDPDTYYVSTETYGVPVTIGRTIEDVTSQFPPVAVYNGKEYFKCGNGTSYPSSCNRYRSTGGGTLVIPIGPYSCSSNPHPICNTVPDPIIENQPVDQSEIDEKVKDWLKTAPWSILDDLLKHPDGTPVDADPIRRAISDWLDDLASRDPNLRYVPPASIVVTNPDGSETPVDYEPNPEPDSSTEEKTRPDAADWPLFCEWAPVICDWLEWTKEMPEDMEPDELPVDEVHASQFQKDYSHGLGGGSCPAPVTFQYAGQSMQFKYDDACWAASNVFRPVLLTMAGIMAAFIIVGASRRAV